MDYSKGKIKALIDRIIEERSQGDPLLNRVAKAKMCMKGIFPDTYSEDTYDDEAVIVKLLDLAKDLKIKVYASEVMTSNPLYKKTLNSQIPNITSSHNGIKTVFTTRSSVSEAVQDLKYQLRDFEFNTLLFFSSSCYNPDELAKQMHEDFKPKHVFGGTTAGEIINGKALRNSIVAMAFSSNVIEDVSVQIIENINENIDVNKAFLAFEEHYREPALKMDFKKYLGLIFIDGISQCEEKVLDKVGDKTNVLFVGGSVADDLKGYKAYVFSNGKAYTNAAMIALVKPKVGFSVLKTQSFNVLPKTLTATKVDEDKREVIEFNGKPAVLAYAEVLGVPPSEITRYFNTNPFGLILDGEIFVRNPNFMIEDRLTLYCGISEGTELHILESTDIVADTRKAFEAKKKEMKSISALIDFHCCFRFLNLEQKNASDEYGKIFGDVPNIGFATLGESYIGHLNQTSVIVLFE